MKTINIEDFVRNLDFYVEEAKKNKIFIYPTDTIYWIGAIDNENNREAIFTIKKREGNKMFPIIAPSFDWIIKTYKTDKTKKELEAYLNKYHGVTYIFDYTIPWARIIKHSIQSFVTLLWLPFITTSCNLSWEKPATNVQQINKEIEEKADYIIDWGIWWGKPSVLVDFVANKIIER